MTARKKAPVKKSSRKPSIKSRVAALAMTPYVGTKDIFARKMNLGEYNILRGWDMPKDENPKAPGYLVVYPDNYRSWSPKAAFEDTYQASGKMNFGAALHMLKHGCKLARKGWNGKKMWIILVPGSEAVKIKRGSAYAKAGIPVTDIGAHIDMRTAQGTMQPGWLASQPDMLATDWAVVG